MGTDDELIRLSAAQAAALIRDGKLSAEELTRACLARIEQREPQVHAWTFLDPEHALNQARAADQARRVGRPTGSLHGVPVGVKDIFDTRDMPTENGTVLHAGRRCSEDATAVSRLRAAGAIVIGKTVTTELAVYTPGSTRNPHDPERTPGGSSSGSAAAVADGMVPLALGSQTNGSVIRPAAYCGVVGFKPSFGLIPRYRVLHQSRLLDHVGVFARTVEDAALLTENLVGHDSRDHDTYPQARPPLRSVAMSDPPVRPRLAFVKTRVWDQAEAVTQAAFAELVEHLGEDVDTVNLPAAFDDAIECHRLIHETDLAFSFAAEYERGRDRLSERLREMIENGQRTLAVDYRGAIERRALLLTLLGELLNQYDALLTPATTGVAPLGTATGSPVFCSLWTLCGVPAISLPLLQDEAGLPLGVQLVGKPHDDARLLRTARWLSNRCAA